MEIKPVLGDWEIPRIESIRTMEHRAFVELPVPGMVGSLFQDMDTDPTRLVISGSLFGDETRNTFLEDLRGKYREGEPVTFVADIVTATDVQYVIIETLWLRESGVRPDQIEYTIVLKESPPPPPPADPFGGLDTDLLDGAGDFLDSITGALDIIDGLGSIPDFGDPTPPLTSAMDGVIAATSGLDTALGPLRDIFGSPD
jgi:hypothetical protein